MSTLRANSIEHTDGGPIALTKQSALKGFISVDQTSSGHPTLGESLNVSSTSDNGTGLTAVTYTSNMSNGNHAITLACNGYQFSGSCSGINSDGNYTPASNQKRTAGCGIDARDQSNAQRDKDDASIMIAGDLA